MTVPATTPMPVNDIPPLAHAEAMRLFATEMERTIDFLRALPVEAFDARTDCPAWDVRRMYLHVLGACEAGASIRENLHQMRAARARQKSHGGPLEAALSAVQVAERENLLPGQLVDRLADVAPVAVRKRTSLPGALRRITLKVDGPVVERWSLGYLVDTIYLRDAWMHRVDAARATGSELVLTPEHDGRIVSDVIAEWARRHGAGFRLTLTGPAGGVFSGGASHADPEGPVMTMDAVDFCRTLAGRVEGEGLLATIVPF
jgi:uncharacterized protein (TIGR03083 family)